MKEPFSTLRVNIGGPEYRDQEGRLWLADQGYYGGGWGCLDMATTDVLTTSDRLTGTNDEPLYQSARVGEEIRYRFSVPNGDYRVRILLAETYWESGDAERQDVFIQGRRVLSNFSMLDEVGHDAALTKEFTARVTDGRLEVRFVGLSLPMHSGARVSGLEVTRVDSKKRRK